MSLDAKEELWEDLDEFEREEHLESDFMVASYMDARAESEPDYDPNTAGIIEVSRGEEGASAGDMEEAEYMEMWSEMDSDYDPGTDI